MGREGSGESLPEGSWRAELGIFPTSLYTIRFVFDHGPRSTDSRCARGRRSDRRNLRSRGVRGPTDAENPQDLALRAVVRVRVAPPRLLPDPPRVVSRRRRGPHPPLVPPDPDFPARSSAREDVDGPAHPLGTRDRLWSAAGPVHGPAPFPRGGPRCG